MTPNRIAAMVLIALSLWFGYQTFQLEKTDIQGEPGSGLFPGLISLFLLFLSVALLVQDIRGKALPRRFDFRVTPGGVRAVIGFLLILVYMVVMPYIGFLISSILFFGSIMWLVGERRSFRLLGFSCGMSLLIYVFFGELFQIPLPKMGLLWGLI